MGEPLAFQHAPRLDEQRAIDRLVGHRPSGIEGMLPLQPPSNLLRRPLGFEFRRHHATQLGTLRTLAPLRALGALPRRPIGRDRPIRAPPAMAAHFPAHRRGRTPQLARDRVAARPRGRGAECAGTRRSRSAAGASQCPSVATHAASAPIAPSALPAITRTALSVVPCALPVNATINTVSHSPFETTRWDLFSHTSRPSIRSLSSIDKVHQFNR